MKIIKKDGIEVARVDDRTQSDQGVLHWFMRNTVDSMAFSLKHGYSVEDAERNPVHYVDKPWQDPVTGEFRLAGWYFWEETWSDRQGPFPDEATANLECEKYARWLEGDQGDTLASLGVDVL